MKEKNRPNLANKITRDRKIKRLIVIGVIVALSIEIGIALSSSKIIFSGASSSPLPIDNIQCNSMEQAAFHIHAHLDVFINGQHYKIPPQIGIIPANASIGYIHMMTLALYT
jgi:hypothetical protein